MTTTAPATSPARSSRPPVSSLYVAKAFAALLVVIGHTPIDLFKVGVYPLTLSAVPIFFLISGYFLYSPDESKSAGRAWRSIKKIIPIFLIVTLIYWLMILPNHGNTVRSWEQVWHFLIYGQLTTVHLWFLMAMLQGLCVLGLALHWRLGRYLWVFVPLMLTALLGGRYSFLITGGEQQNLIYVFNSVSYALPFMSAGYLIKKYEDKIPTHFPWVVLTLLMMALAIVEQPLLRSYGYNDGEGPYIGSFLFAVALFFTGITHKGFGTGSWAETVGAKYSGNIYYFHIAVATVIAPIFIKLGAGSFYMQTGAIWVFAASLLLAFVIVKLQDRLGIHILQ